MSLHPLYVISIFNCSLLIYYIYLSIYWKQLIFKIFFPLMVCHLKKFSIGICMLSLSHYIPCIYYGFIYVSSIPTISRVLSLWGSTALDGTSPQPHLGTSLGVCTPTRWSAGLIEGQHSIPGPSHIPQSGRKVRMYPHYYGDIILLLIPDFMSSAIY